MDNENCNALSKRVGQSSPVRWIVVAHALLLSTVLALFQAFPKDLVMQVVSPAVVATQTMLLVIWLNLGGGVRTRGLLGTAGYLYLMAGLHAPAVWRMPFFLSLMIGLPLSALVIALLGLPLAMVRIEGLRLRRFGSAELPPRQRLQFNMFHLLWVMASLAVFFGLGQVAQVGSHGSGGIETIAFLVTILITAAILMSVPLACVWAVLTPGPVLPRLAVATLGWGLGGLLIAYYYQPVATVAAVPAAIAVLAVAFLLATLSLTRRFGYRVVWRAVGER
jgi:hypothetical protein